MIDTIPYLCILLLNIANNRYKRLKYKRYDINDLISIAICIIGLCGILL